jgi:outer membrane receptor protein involved in Fe transport
VGEIKGRTTIGIAYYINDTDKNIRFTPNVFYSSHLLPPGWALTGLPPQLLDLLALEGIVFPAQFTYVNLGPLRNQGIELSLNQVVDAHTTFNLNYSYQKDPEIRSSSNPFPAGALIFAPNHRFNAGVNIDYPRWLANASVNYASKAFWTDVLDARFWGPTPAYTMVNATFGLRWMNRKLTTSLKVNNLFNEQIQQHIFGDILRRSVIGEAKFIF